MFRRSLLVTSLLVFGSTAQAQMPNAQQPQPMQEALGQKLFAEINAGLSCGAELLTTRRELEAARAQIKAMTEAKAAPPEAPKQ